MKIGVLLALVLHAFWLPKSVAQIEAEKGTIAIHIDAEILHQRWIADAFEQNIYRDLYNFKTLKSVERQSVDTSLCQDRKIECLLSKYKQAGVDILIYGVIFQDRLRYGVYSTEALSPVGKAELFLNSNLKLMNVRFQTLKLLKPFLEKGGILENKIKADGQRKEKPTSELVVVKADRVLIWPLAIFLLFIFLLPKVLAARLKVIRRVTLKTNADRVQIGLGVLGLTVAGVLGWTGYQPLAFPFLGGILWALLSYYVLCFIVSPMPGLEGIKFGILFSVLRAWSYVFVFRAFLIFSIGWVAASLVFYIGASIGALRENIIYLGLPLGGFAFYFWIQNWFNLISAYLDSYLVSGESNSHNPWTHHIKSYFLTYCQRLGLEFDEQWLNSICFLPGNKGFDAISYGTKSSFFRVVVHESVLQFALGSLEELSQKPDQNVSQHKDYLFGILLNEVGKLQRRTQYLTMIGTVLSFESWEKFMNDDFRADYERLLYWLDWLYQVGFGRYTAILDTAYMALNFGKHYMIQYLYMLRGGDLECLTVKADSDLLFKVSVNILTEFRKQYQSKPELQIPGNTAENRLVWLSQHFHSPIRESRGVAFRSAFVTLFILVGLHWVYDQISESVNFASIYRQRIENKEIEIRAREIRERKFENE